MPRKASSIADARCRSESAATWGTWIRTNGRESFAKVLTTDEVVNRGTPYVVGEILRIIGEGPTYLSFDVDVIDPTHAPGVADPEVNGLTVREITQIIHGLEGLHLMGADIVCYCPPLDNPAQITALTISSLMLDLVTLIVAYQKLDRRLPDRQSSSS